MARARSRLKLTTEEDSALRKLYQIRDIATDQYAEEDLAWLVDNWQTTTGRTELASDLMHYMVTLRKQGKWVKVGRKSGSSILERSGLQPEDLVVLDAIHEEFQISSDSFAQSPELAAKLAKEFARRTNKIVPAGDLAKVMIDRRKRGLLATTKPKHKSDDLGFGDFDKVVG